MDQDTSKTPGKGSWRDRLGIGAGNREMPKLSGEFKAGRDGQNGTASSETTPRGPQIVTKTAPMAPRTPAAVQDKSSDRRAERRPPPGNQQQGDNQDLAMRLKAQREAAEKVAHQRVSQARGRAERGGSEKPRFSFAEEEVAQARRETTPARERGDGQPSFANKLAAANQTVTAGQPGARSTGPSAGPTLQSSKSATQKPPPLLPPRPALGGEKPISGPPAYPSRYTPSSQQTGSPGYRPLDPPSYQSNRAGTRHTAVPPLGEAGDHRKLPGRDGAEAFRRRVDPDHPEGAGYHDYQRGGGTRARTPAYNDDSGDLFEEERPTTARRRASAQDYNEAYREFDESYSEEGRRRGPWLLLLFLLIAAIAAGGIIYYYLTEIKPAGQSGGNVPVINAPEQPAKVDPEPNSTTGQQAPGATDAQRKQIYDRILGDEAIDGNRIVPTEQQPKAVEPSATGAGQTGNQTDPAQPGANNTANPDGTVEPLPLPLPPPPGENGQQGALTNGSSQEAAAVAAKEMSTSASATAGNSQPSPSDDIIEPIAGEADGPVQPTPAKPVVDAKPKVASSPQSTQDTEVILDKPVAAAKPAAKKPATKTAARAKPAAGTGEDAAQGPLVLVPQRGTQVQGAASAASTEQSADQPAAKEGPFNGIFKPTGKKTSGSPTGKRRDDVVTPGTSRGNWTSAPPSVGDGASNEQVSSITASLDPPAGQGLPEQQGAAQDTATVQQGVPVQQVVAIEPGEQVQQGAPAPEGQPVQQVASVQQGEPAQQAAPDQLPESAPAQGSTAQEKPPSGQYIAQLASFQSQAEAMAEYNRLQAAHGDVLRGLKPTVSASTISGRYRLGVGPMASREAASGICNALISAGERDCLVRGN